MYSKIKHVGIRHFAFFNPGSINIDIIRFCINIIYKHKIKCQVKPFRINYSKYKHIVKHTTKATSILSCYMQDHLV